MHETLLNTDHKHPEVFKELAESLKKYTYIICIHCSSLSCTAVKFTVAVTESSKGNKQQLRKQGNVGKTNVVTLRANSMTTARKRNGGIWMYPNCSNCRKTKL